MIRFKKKKINISAKQVVEEGKGEVIENKTKSCLRKVPIIEGKQSFLPARQEKDHTMVP